MKEVPLFLLNGFLESGKTSLIKEIVENNPDYQNNTTVIIACEQGEIEYDEDWQKKYGVHVEYIENQEDFTPDYMKALDKRYMADRYVIEYNSFFDFDNQDFPRYMVIYQQITLIDASKFIVMFNNMKKVFSSMLKYSSLVIFNRCDGIKELAQFRRQVRGINQQAQIAFETANGQLTTMLDEDFRGEITVPEGCVFVMGDNRNASTDSRTSSVGMIDTREIFGKVYLIVFPGKDNSDNRDWSRIGGVKLA